LEERTGSLEFDTGALERVLPDASFRNSLAPPAKPTQSAFGLLEHIR
jgi:hypothetical protein